MRRLLSARAAAPAAERPAEAPSWLSELAAPPDLARWASSFSDLKSCWTACADPEWLLWLAARTAAPGAPRESVVLCAAEIVGLVRPAGRDVDPRVVSALAMVPMWAGLEAEPADLFAAERDALQAAGEWAQAADQAAQRARLLLRVAPRRRLSSSGMNGALGAVQRWREAERRSCLALAAASVARAAALAAAPTEPAAPAESAAPTEPAEPTGMPEPTVTDAEWVGCVSQSVAYALRAMPGRRAGGGQPSKAVTRRCLRLAKLRLTAP